MVISIKLKALKESLRAFNFNLLLIKWFHQFNKKEELRR